MDKVRLVVPAVIAMLVGASLALATVGGIVASQTSHQSFATVASNPIVVGQQPFISANVRKKDVRPKPSWVCSPPDDEGFMTCLIPVTSTDQKRATDDAKKALRGAQSNTVNQSPTINIINEASDEPEPSDDGVPWLTVAGLLLTAAIGLWGVWANREHIPALKARVVRLVTRRERQDHEQG